MSGVVSVKELMGDLLDPLADNVFDAVGAEATADGIREWGPETDEDWQKVRIGAVAMIEGSQLLHLARAWAPPGDLNNSTGPDASELSPSEIEAKRAADPVLWQAKVQALKNAGLAVLDVVERRDAAALIDAGIDLDNACETCHLEFWYPGELEFLDRIHSELPDNPPPPPPAASPATP
ncbi:MAG: hypothetical protein FJW23_11180 [Acidimicrobiia bacterium]|nr:hypothetical protein [Acidimicrobiia bacterium]